METKSTLNYVASFAKKLSVVLQISSDVQESQAFKTLRDDLTARMEEIRVEISTEYILKAVEITLSAKRNKYHAAFCTYIRQVASTFIAQHDTKNYDGDQAILDLLEYNSDDLLVPVNLTPREFLLVYKDTNKIQRLPYPTVSYRESTRRMIDFINGVTTPMTSSTSPQITTTAVTPTNNNIVNPYIKKTVANISPLDNMMKDDDDSNSNNYGGYGNSDEEDDDNDFDQHHVVTGGKHHIARLTMKALMHTVYHPIEDFHQQLQDNEETKRIKNLLTPTRLDAAATRIASVLGKEPPAAQPVLRGLIEETAEKKLMVMEPRIQSTEDKLTAMTSKKVKGDGTKKKGTPTAVKEDAPKSTPKSTAKSFPKTTIRSSSKATTKPTKSILKNCEACNDDTASNKKKSKGRNLKVSFEGKKAKSKTSSRK
jgi:hypothetical protein